MTSKYLLRIVLFNLTCTMSKINSMINSKGFFIEIC